MSLFMTTLICGIFLVNIFFELKKTSNYGMELKLQKYQEYIKVLPPKSLTMVFVISGLIETLFLCFLNTFLNSITINNIIFINVILILIIIYSLYRHQLKMCFYFDMASKLLIVFPLTQMMLYYVDKIF